VLPNTYARFHAYVTWRAKVLLKEHLRELKLPHKKFYEKLSHAPVQSVNVAVVTEHH
jgi:hypothetical protein